MGGLQIKSPGFSVDTLLILKRLLMTTNKIPVIERMGIRPQFPRLTAYLKSEKKRADEGENDPFIRLERYAKEGGGFVFNYRYSTLGEREYHFYNVHQDLMLVTNALRIDAIQAAFGEGSWQVIWQRSNAYAYWYWRMKYITHRQIFDEFENGKRTQYLGTLSLQRMGNVIADCLALGWPDWAIDLSERAHWALDHGGFFDGGDLHHLRTQCFILRLIGDWQDWPERVWPSWAMDEPIFNALVEHWRTPNPDDIAPLLLAACDRHTYQSKAQSSTAQWDISNSDAWYDPYEILTIFKLRELHGLDNPVLDHLLMNTPLGKLSEAVPPYTDELLEGVLAEAMKEYTDF